MFHKLKHRKPGGLIGIDRTAPFKTEQNAPSPIMFKPGERIIVTVTQGEATRTFAAIVVGHAPPLLEITLNGGRMVYNTGSNHFLSVTRQIN